MRSSSAGIACLLVSLLLYAGTAMSQSASSRIEVRQDSDYFGFDLRVEQDSSLDQCQQACLDDAQCKAFTYVEKQRWCFLKTIQKRVPFRP